VSWRADSSAVGTATFFFPEFQRVRANAYERENYKTYVGKNGCFTPQDRRFIWAPYGDDWNLDENWQYFFDSREKFERIKKTKRELDPHDVFTPNLFCVGASESAKLKKNMKLLQNPF
jgi:hypothetical protein